MVKYGGNAGCGDDTFSLVENKKFCFVYRHYTCGLHYRMELGCLFKFTVSCVSLLLYPMYASIYVVCVLSDRTWDNIHLLVMLHVSHIHAEYFRHFPGFAGLNLYVYSNCLL
jgi:hypothetical protein